MNGKTAKLLNRIAGKAKRPSRGFKKTWLATAPAERGKLRRNIEKELGPLRIGRARLSPIQHRELRRSIAHAGAL